MRAISSMIGRGLAALAERVNPAVPEAMAGRVRMEQVQSILRMTPVMMSANIVIALLVNLAGLTGPHRVILTVWAAAVSELCTPCAPPRPPPRLALLTTR